MNWEERIANAEQTGAFTREDRLAVEQYQTCATGERWPEQIEQLCQTIVDPSYLYLDQLALAMFSAVRMDRVDR